MMTLHVSNLTCEYRLNPIGLDTLTPRFTWQLSTDIKQTLQSAYHIQVTQNVNSFESSNLVWDSGKVESEQSVLIPYKGKLLQPRSRYFYRVKVWDQNRLESLWSETSFWEMGQLSAADWTAEWITPDAASIDSDAEAAFYLRKTFIVRGATPKDLIATCFYAYSTSLFVKAAEVLGRYEDVAQYSELYERIVEAFSQEFLTPSGRLAAHTQTAHVLPPMFGLVDGAVKERLDVLWLPMWRSRKII